MPSANPVPEPPKSRLPPPSTYDILPPLHALLSRLLLSFPQTTGQTSASPPAGSPTLSSVLDSIPLSPKDLATAVSAVKIRIQKARVATGALPDVERTVEEQEVEITQLKAEIERLEGAMKNLSIAAKRAAEQQRGQTRV